MKKIVLSAMVALAAVTMAVPAMSADLKMVRKAPVAPPPPPSPWDIAFGGNIQSNYVFRGITQSNGTASAGAYFEPRYNISDSWQLYAGIAGQSISFPNRAAAEIDFYGGVRPTFGPLALDLGFIYYYYPKCQCFAGATNGLGQANDADCVARGPLPINGNFTKAKADFYEWYAKGVYTINEMWALGGNFFYTPSYANTGADGEYLSGTLKFTAPGTWLPAGVGMYLSGEFGRQWLGTSDSFYGTVAFPNGIKYADYNTWNIGIGFTYKVFTLDFRYSDTDLSKGDCNAFTSDFSARGNINGTNLGTFVTPINPTGVGSNWCGAAGIVKLSADLTAMTNLK